MPVGTINVSVLAISFLFSSALLPNLGSRCSKYLQACPDQRALPVPASERGENWAPPVKLVFDLA